MFLAELIPAFKGFSDKIIPGAVAAVDNPVFWPYAPNAALLGFVCTAVGQLIGLGLLIIFRSPVVAIPSVIPIFFGGSTLGIFANAYGGWRGVIFATTIVGIIEPIGCALLASTAGVTIGIEGHTDWATIWAVFFTALKWFNGI